ncbi:MAG: type II toxin-antitoxin system PemK/MazF family toxin [Acidobacteria bacterium]|nr:type II toxin-antitoxin system PemK/MazF family toxin [Acidobacteriota bacterium]
MNEGDVVLVVLPQADGKPKNRPAAALRRMPPFGDWLVCGITTRQRHEVEGFDDPIRPEDDDYFASGLKAPSVIRLGFLAVLPENRLLGTIGSIAPARHQRLLDRLCEHLSKNQRPDPPEQSAR